MKVRLLRSKLHRIRVTGKSLDYEGTLLVDPVWMEAVGLLPYEHIEVYNVTNGNRWTTYVIPGSPGSGAVELNGAAARLGEVGDLLIVTAYAWVDTREIHDFQVRVALFDEENRLLEVRRLAILPSPSASSS